MTILAAWRDGAGRVNRAPLLLASVWLMTVAIGMPLALVLRGMIAQHLGSSMEAERASAGVNYDWMQEFADQASGVGVTFKPTVIGFGAVLDNLNAFLDDVSRPLVIASAASAYVALWLFVAGGIWTATRGIVRPGRTDSLRRPACSSGGSFGSVSCSGSRTPHCSEASTGSCSIASTRA